jgi:hypothetical protein
VIDDVPVRDLATAHEVLRTLLARIREGPVS